MGNSIVNVVNTHSHPGLPSLNNSSPLKLMDGRWICIWDCLFSGANMLVSGSVHIPVSLIGSIPRSRWPIFLWKKTNLHIRRKPSYESSQQGKQVIKIAMTFHSTPVWFIGIPISWLIVHTWLGSTIPEKYSKQPGFWWPEKKHLWCIGRK